MEGQNFSNYDDSYYYYNYSSSELPEDCPAFQVPFKDILLPALYGTLFLLGVVGNAVLMGALILKRRVQRLVDIFIINLAASDFIFLITLPFWVDNAMYSGLWRSGSFFCKGSSYIISVNMFCSIFLLTCLCIDRYLAIMHPSMTRRIRTKLYAIILCVCIWILSCLLGLPTLLSRHLKSSEDGNIACMEKDPTLANRIVALLVLILAFFIPLFIILMCYCSITRKLCVHYHKSGKHDKKLRKSIRIVFIVVIAFVFSWTPFNIFKLLALLLGIQEQKPSFCLPYKVAYLGMELSAPFAFANSCINPFIYYVFDDYISRAVIRLVCMKTSSLGISSDTSDSRLSYSMNTFVRGEDASRRRRRSVSF